MFVLLVLVETWSSSCSHTKEEEWCEAIFVKKLDLDSRSIMLCWVEVLCLCICPTTGDIFSHSTADQQVEG